MKTIPAILLVLSVAACASPLGTEPTSPPDAPLGASTQAKAVPSLVIETVSGDCASGITVRVTGWNIPARARFGGQALNKTDYTNIPEVVVDLGKGWKKSIQWTTFWPAAAINPATGAKFNGTAQAYVTDAWGVWLEQTSAFIGPAC